MEGVSRGCCPASVCGSPGFVSPGFVSPGFVSPKSGRSGGSGAVRGRSRVGRPAGGDADGRAASAAGGGVAGRVAAGVAGATGAWAPGSAVAGEAPPRGCDDGGWSASGHGEPVMPDMPGDWALALSGAARAKAPARPAARTTLAAAPATVNASDDLRLAADLSGAYSVITRPLT